MTSQPTRGQARVLLRCLAMFLCYLCLMCVVVLSTSTHSFSSLFVYLYEMGLQPQF